MYIEQLFFYLPNHCNVSECIRTNNLKAHLREIPAFRRLIDNNRKIYMTANEMLAMFSIARQT